MEYNLGQDHSHKGPLPVFRLKPCYLIGYGNGYLFAPRDCVVVLAPPEELRPPARVTVRRCRVNVFKNFKKKKNTQC